MKILPLTLSSVVSQSEHFDVISFATRIFFLLFLGLTFSSPLQSLQPFFIFSFCNCISALYAITKGKSPVSTAMSELSFSASKFYSSSKCLAGTRSTLSKRLVVNKVYFLSLEQNIRMPKQL